MKIKFGIAVGLSAIIQCAFGFGITSSVEKQVQSPKEDKMVNKSESSPVVKGTQESGKFVGEDFIIGSGDVLNIFVWKELEERDAEMNRIVNEFKMHLQIERIKMEAKEN